MRERSVTRAAVLDTVTCPNCRSEVSTRAASCRSCHLPMTDVIRHQPGVRSRRRTALTTRLWGLLAYAGIAAWCLLQLPTAAVFVVPAAAVAAVLHVVRGRPYVAVLVFVVIVALAPLLFWPSMTTELFDELGSLVSG